jgi:ribose transport system ATP-binding protein
VSALRVDGLAKRFGSTLALAGVDLEARRGEIHALLGGNGSGKSTLIKALAGVQPADAGRIQLGGRSYDASRLRPADVEQHLRVVHQQPTTFGPLSVAENLATGGFPTKAGGRIAWRRLYREAQATLDRFGLDVDARWPLERLSPARQKTVEIIRALQGSGDAADAEILILDEPTAALPASEVSLLLDQLRQLADDGRVILYVTHRLHELVGFAHRATILRDGAVIGRLDGEEITMARLVDLIAGEVIEQAEAIARDAAPAPEVLSVHELRGGPLSGVSFSVCRGEIVGLAGLVGSGRSSLLQMIFGLLQPSGGSITVEGQHVRAVLAQVPSALAYVPEDRQRSAAFPLLTVRENLSAADLSTFRRGARLDHRAEHRAARAAIERYNVKAAGPDAPFRTLSGGNQQKVVLARWLRRRPRLLLLDEPTQGVDVKSRADIHRFIREATTEGAAALVASSDLEELCALCDRVLVLSGGRVAGELTGNALEPRRLERMSHGFSLA